MNLLKHLFVLILLLNTQFAHSQIDSVRMFIFGHSLLDHRPPINPTPSDETTVPHWLQLLSDHDNRYYGATGQYGFLPQHDNLPPIAQWGYDIVNPVWDSDIEPFADADFSTVLVTAGNFMQWQGPDEPYPGEGGVTPVSATEDIVDWLELQEDSLGIYIYENWPDMAPYLSGGTFPPSDADFENYNDYTTDAFHDWWIEYQDALLAARPDINVRMIPVGPIMARLFRDTLLTEIPVTDLYEDDAPHGRPTVYFLASLITYMAIHQETAPLDYDVPSIVNSIVEDNYAALVCYIWNELNDFNDVNGVSRVFYPQATLPLSLLSFEGREDEANIELSWVTSQEEDFVSFELQHATDGLNFESIGTLQGAGPSTIAQGYSFTHQHVQTSLNFYRLKQTSSNGLIDYSDIITVNKSKRFTPPSIFPNPFQHNIRIDRPFSKALNYEVISILGKPVQAGILSEGETQIDLSPLNSGTYFLKIKEHLFKLVKTE